MHRHGASLTSEGATHWRRVFGFLQLLGSGAIAALGLTALASNRWHLLDSSTAVFLLLFIQWERLGLTIAKCGLEHVVFAATSRDPSVQFDIRRTVLRRIAPLGGAFGAVALASFPAWACFALATCVILDSYALLRTADLVARGRFGVTSLAGLLNYPLFFVLVAVLALTHHADVVHVVLAFVASSAVRLLWLEGRSLEPGTRRVVLSGQRAMAAQPVGNYALFRADQILLASTFIQGRLGLGPAFLAGYLYLAKLPELAAGVLTTAGSVSFPAFLRSDDALLKVGRRFRSARGALAAGCALAVLVGVGAIYVSIWNGDAPLTLASSTPFLVHVALIFPVNALTYVLLSRGYVRALIRFLVIGLAAGSVLGALAIAAQLPSLVAWVVPLQLATMLGAATFLRWGRHRTVYLEEDVASPS